jgi:hypothetical protein
MIAMVVAIVVILASILSAVFIFLPASEDDNKKSGNGEHGQLSLFPALDVTLEDSGGSDTLTIKHLNGDPLDWSDYKIIITNEIDNSVVQITCSLDENFVFGEIVVVDEELCPSFGDMNFMVGDFYTIEIYAIKENKLAFQLKHLICGGDQQTGKFPIIEAILKDSSTTNEGDELSFKHISGDPLDWSKHKILMTNNSDETDTAAMMSLSGITSAGEIITFDSSTIGFADIDYQQANFYTVEIYNLKENRREYEKSNVICE